MIIVLWGSDELPLKIQSISGNGKETYASEARFESFLKLKCLRFLLSSTALKRREIIAVNIGH